jgi:hypothetical protein
VQGLLRSLFRCGFDEIDGRSKRFSDRLLVSPEQRVGVIDSHIDHSASLLDVRPRLHMLRRFGEPRVCGHHCLAYGRSCLFDCERLAVPAFPRSELDEMISFMLVQVVAAALASKCFIAAWVLVHADSVCHLAVDPPLARVRCR